MGRPSSTNSTSGNTGTPQTSINNNEVNQKTENIASEQKIKNKIEHIMGEKNLVKHHLDSVVNEFGGNKSIAYSEIDKKIQQHVSDNNIKDGKTEGKVSINGHIITFKGYVSNGVYSPGTYYVAEEDFNNEKKRTK